MHLFVGDVAVIGAMTHEETHSCVSQSAVALWTLQFLARGDCQNKKMKLQREKSGFMYECCAVDSQQTVKNAKIRFLIVANCF